MEEKACSDKVITVPNVLSVIRLCLIPLFIVQYVVFKRYDLAAITVIVSGVTDIADGFIARKFDMISHVGRILDPVADKLTQISVMLCLCFRYNAMIVLLAVLVVKELINGIIALIMLKRTKRTMDSKWHGKVATVLLYVTLILHLFWIDIPILLSHSLIAACGAAVLFSFVMYTVSNVKKIAAGNPAQTER